MQKLLNQFNKIYEQLYNNDSKNIYTCGYNEAVTAFDEKMKDDSFKKLLGEFILFSGDFIMSDREAAAFMFALSDLDMI
ncbi:hypothetical protein [Eremococcus coleocola]|uniref:hypothetical protein n=1 Tax=Eremococcus coleocola TaxID=88132 RepID=UPI0004167784|nr:hypothetical protein [Eremococcus coleocola]